MLLRSFLIVQVVPIDHLQCDLTTLWQLRAFINDIASVLDPCGERHCVVVAPPRRVGQGSERPATPSSGVCAPQATAGRGGSLGVPRESGGAGAFCAVLRDRTPDVIERLRQVWFPSSQRTFPTSSPTSSGSERSSRHSMAFAHSSTRSESFHCGAMLPVCPGYSHKSNSAQTSASEQ